MSTNLPWLVSVDLGEAVRAMFRAPVHLSQEIRCLARGQLLAEPEVRDFLLVDFGAGVGSAAVIAGDLHQGALPVSGELGHTPVEGNRQRCGCRGVGCLETLISRAAIARAVLRTQSPPDDWSAVAARVEQDGLSPALEESIR